VRTPARFSVAEPAYSREPFTDGFSRAWHCCRHTAVTNVGESDTAKAIVIRGAGIGWLLRVTKRECTCGYVRHFRRGGQSSCQAVRLQSCTYIRCLRIFISHPLMDSVERWSRPRPVRMWKKEKTNI